MKVFITGALSQVACELPPLLEIEGYSSLALTRDKLDITDRQAVISAVDEYAPDVIINCAAYTAVDRAESEEALAYRVNVDGAANIAGAALKAGACLIHISTDFVFDGTGKRPYREGDPTGPHCVYARSKLKGEQEISRILERFIIVRSSWLYGRYGSNFVKTVLRLAEERDTLRIVSDQVGSPTWTADLAGALVAFVRALSLGVALGAGGDRGVDFGIYHYAGNGSASWFDLASAVLDQARALGHGFKCAVVEPITTAEYPCDARRPAYSVLDTSRIEAELDIEIRPWKDSLRLMLTGLYRGDDV